MRSSTTAWKLSATSQRTKPLIDRVGAHPVRDLSVEDVLAMHHAIMTRLGDKPRHLVHPDRLESALARPQSRRKWGNADLVEQAAYLAAGISQAQAFEKGNKRTAFMAMRLFLRENGLRFRGDGVGLADQLIAIAVRTGSMDEAMEHFTTWLRGQCLEAPLQRPS